jgi:YVTN family beta-propeller protein
MYFCKNSTPHSAPHVRALRQGFMVLFAIPWLIWSVEVGQAQTAPFKPGSFVYTADEHGQSISAIDLAAGTVATISLSVSPHNVQITPDRMHVLAVGQATEEVEAHGHSGGEHGDDKPEGKLLVMSTEHLTAKPDEIAVGSHPAHVIADQSGKLAFVTNAGDDSVSVANIQTKRLVTTIGVGRYPHGLRISPDGSEVYVANVEDGTLSVIDARRMTELARISVGATPVQVAFTPDGTRVYVSLRDKNQVAVVDTSTRTVIGTIDVGPNPIQLHATADGQSIYVANQGTEAKPNDTVSVIDVADGKVVETIRTGKGAHGVTVSTDGAFVFITNIEDGTVSAIDTATRKVIAEFSVGRGPNGITYRAP